ncbi:MAG: DUF58 domain-containing protein [Ignavibacteriales bacterium CG_4_9_14_3_um_filter_34_10]|nr:MAG: DUF58 domain-containing protein [Ignavibacteriales bacterium CG_4_9_14_3_um_filter_34_10]
MQNKFSIEQKYLNPIVVSKLNSLELKARLVVEGFKAGLHKSPYHGFSVEFSQHRPYMQGDSIKNIDWKVYAKSEKYFIKQYEEETNLIADIIVDCSNSMNFKSDANISKFEYSIILAAAFSYLLINQQDAAGLHLFAEKLKVSIPYKSSRSHLKTILTELNNIKPAGITSISAGLDEVAKRINKRGLTIIISDFFDDLDEIISSIKRIHYKKNEIIIFQILDLIELDFGFGSDKTFVDLETNEKISTLPFQIQRAYQEAMNDFLSKFKNECLSLGVEYNLITTKTPFDKALFSYFAKRSRLN